MLLRKFRNRDCVREHVFMVCIAGLGMFYGFEYIKTILFIIIPAN
jgi:hypothetical protein